MQDVTIGKNPRHFPSPISPPELYQETRSRAPSKLSIEALSDPSVFYNYKNHSTVNKDKEIQAKKRTKELRLQLMEELKVT